MRDERARRPRRRARAFYADGLDEHHAAAVDPALAVAEHLTAALASTPEPAWFASPSAFGEHVSAVLAHLFTARPTAVNLGVATRRLGAVLAATAGAGQSVREAAVALVAEARAVDAEDVGRNRAMARWGGEWLVERVRAAGGAGDALNVMTVCNTGSLATSVGATLEEKIVMWLS